MSRYAIWDKQSPILTPIGEVLTPEQWIQRYPIAGVESITVICAGGEINGGFFGTLGQLVEIYSKDGCDFSACETAQDKLDAIEVFLNQKETDAKAKAAKDAETKAINDELTATSLASIAASMEFQNMMSLPDEEV